MNKKSLSERDICTKFITPALAAAGWDVHSQSELMPTPSPANPKLSDYVPDGLVKHLRSHFTGKIQEAVERYRFNDADEDSLTGALGHALSTGSSIRES